MIYDVPAEGSRERVLLVPRIGPDKQPLFRIEDIEDEARKASRQAHWHRVQRTDSDSNVMMMKAAKSASYRRLLLAMCKKSAAFWVDHFVKTWDDRLDIPLQNFTLYPKQKEILDYLTRDFIENPGRQTVFIEKSRATGYSWEVMAAFPTWAWLFQDGFTTILGAVLLEDIDNGGKAATLDSHMGRIRFILKNLPEWMVPRGLENESFNKKLILQNPEKPNNVINGRQISSNLGRMARKTMAILDEVAHCDNGEFDAAMTSLSQVTNRIVVGTTPIGLDTDSARLRFSGLKMKVFTVHWTSNPNLDVHWYWEQRAAFGPEKCASELDISYTASVANRIFRDFDPAVNIVDVEYDPTLPLHVAIDPGRNDPMALIWIQPSREDKTYRIIDFALFPGKTGEWCVPLLLGYFPKNRDGLDWRLPKEEGGAGHYYDADALAMIERHGKWNPIDEAYGDAGGTQQTQVADYSLYDLLYEYGVAKPFGGIVPVKHADKLEAVQRAEIAMSRVRIARRLETQKSSVSIETIVDSFQQYEWAPTDSPTGRAMKKAPKHNVFSHGMDAWQFYLAGKEEDVVDPKCSPLAPEARRYLSTIPDDTGRSGTFVPDYEKDGGSW